MVRWWMAQDVMFKFSTLVFVFSTPVIGWLVYVAAVW
jgi:hypothetical protein